MENENQEFAVIPEKKKRPFLLSLILIFSLVYFLFFSAMFLLSFFYSGKITEVVNMYVPRKLLTVSETNLIFIAGFILHVTAFTGLVMMWHLKKKGYLIFAISSILITLIHLLLPAITPLNTLLHVILILLTGLFLKRLN